MIRKWFNRYRVIVQLLLFAFGLVLLFIPVVVQLGSNELNLVFFSLATSMMASILLSFFEYLMGTDIPSAVEQRLNFNRQVYDHGLDAVHLYGDVTIFDRFVNAHSIDIMSASAKGTCQQYGRRIISAIETHGCNVRILISDPENFIWGSEDISDALCPSSDIPGEIKDTERYLRQLVAELKRNRPFLKSGSLELRIYPFVPTSGILIVDGTFVRHTPYLPSHHSVESPTYDITRERGGGLLFRNYHDTFNWVWDRSKTVFQESWVASQNNH